MISTPGHIYRLVFVWPFLDLFSFSWNIPVWTLQKLSGTKVPVRIGWHINQILISTSPILRLVSTHLSNFSCTSSYTTTKTQEMRCVLSHLHKLPFIVEASAMMFHKVLWIRVDFRHGVCHDRPNLYKQVKLHETTWTIITEDAHVVLRGSQNAGSLPSPGMPW